MMTLVTFLWFYEAVYHYYELLKVQARTWSNYKQHNTVKFLIAVTPQETISFVSKAWR